jgi:hypothetical protein
VAFEAFCFEHGLHFREIHMRWGCESCCDDGSWGSDRC